MSISNGEIESDIFTSEFFVSRGESVKFVFQSSVIFTVKEDFNHFGTIDTDFSSLANDFSREDQVLEQFFVNRGQSTRTRAGLFFASVTGGFGHDTTLSDDQDVTVREFLFELTDETGLDFVVGFELGDGDEDDNGAFTVTDFDLWVVIIRVDGVRNCGCL